MARQDGGFSLVELVAVVAVFAVVLAVAAPGFSRLRERHAALEAFHSLSVALAGARMAAIQRGRPVSICPSADGQRCRLDLVWDEGWLVYLDARRRPQPERAADVLWHEQRAAGPLAIRGSPGRHRVRYQPTGLSGGSNASLRVCSRDGRHLGSVVINLAGRARREWVSGQEPVPCPYLP
ncbi:GspH/FimT family protein [Arenimonas aestuarii]